MSRPHGTHEHPRQQQPQQASAAEPNGHAEAKPADAEAEIHARLAAAERELAETKDQLLRTLADQQNFSRVSKREREEAVRYAASLLAGDLLESLDNLRRAVESTPPDEAVDQLLNGVLATERNLLAALSKHGIRKLEPLGEPFDPKLHHAIYQREDPNFDHGAVIEVVQPGYMMHDRLLRPALVGVANNEKIQPLND